MEPINSGIFNPWQPGLLSWSIYAVMVVGLILTMLAMASWVGDKRHSRDKDMAYECGLIPTGNARFRLPAKYYLVAIFFLIFDIEGVFILQWAVGARGLGVSGWLQVSFFVFVLMLSLFYVWAKGGLSWGKTPHRTGESSQI